MGVSPGLPPALVLDPFIRQWLLEDIGRGDRATESILADASRVGMAEFRLKQSGVMAGLSLAHRVFQLLDPQVEMKTSVQDGEVVAAGTTVAQLHGPLNVLLMGERVALNLVMRLSGIATLTRQYADAIADLPAQLADTRKTTPGLRLLEKYATRVGGACNHRFGLDDMAMIKDNHIVAARGIGAAMTLVRQSIPFPMAIEVETESLEQVAEAVSHGADIIMLDNMSLAHMQAAVALIRQHSDRIQIEASGNITLENIRSVALCGVDYISTSAPITQAPWLDWSLRFRQT
ncbi:MAG: carboxylating nicotinate-nucleotide diphosphorylase [Thermosynechococcaceae cyanobacterium]